MNFSLEIFQQLVDNNVLDHSYIGKLSLYLITTIQKLQSPSEDADSKQWYQETLNYFDAKIEKPLDEFLIYHLKKVIQKVALIQKQILELRKNN